MTIDELIKLLQNSGLAVVGYIFFGYLIVRGAKFMGGNVWPAVLSRWDADRLAEAEFRNRWEKTTMDFSAAVIAGQEINRAQTQAIQEMTRLLQERGEFEREFMMRITRIEDTVTRIEHTFQRTP